MLWLVALVLLAVSFLRSGRTRLTGVTRPKMQPHSNPTSVSTPLPTTLISYSHHGSGSKQVNNLGFYLRHGQLGPYESFVQTVYTASGSHCKLCDTIVTSMGLTPVPGGAASYPHGTVTEALRLGSVTLLRRQQDYGWEFANHNITLEWLSDKSPESLRAVKYFVFVGSSVQGPFLPTYFSHNTHWTQAFTGMLNAHVKLVAPSLVCLPPSDEAGPGAHLDTYVFAMDIVGLGVARRSGALNIHRDNKRVLLKNHYGLTSAVFEAGYKVTTLLYKYGDNIDWQDPANWKCNDWCLRTASAATTPSRSTPSRPSSSSLADIEARAAAHGQEVRELGGREARRDRHEGPLRRGKVHGRHPPPAHVQHMTSHDCEEQLLRGKTTGCSSSRRAARRRRTSSSRRGWGGREGRGGGQRRRLPH